ncbi:MAG: DNA cytosine methyltransferase [Shewanella sp.]
MTNRILLKTGMVSKKISKLTHGSLSTGICGFDIGAQQNGIETLWTCEIDELRKDVIKFIIPHAKHYADLRTFKDPEYVDIISFGFPCQDISIANPKGKGLEGNKSGLWYAGWRIIRKCRPKVVIIENSPNLIHKGLRTILGQLAAAGYDAEWNIISCKRFGLPHLRNRIFIVAYSNKIRFKKNNGIFGSELREVVQPENKNNSARAFPQSEFSGINSWEIWGETIRGVHHLDDGIPKNILYGLLAAAGDTVSPRITAWIFSRIKEAFKEKIDGIHDC